MLSLNELHALVVRASVGAGLAFGHAQEVAAAAIWLGQHGFPACEIVAGGLARACKPRRLINESATRITWGHAIEVRDGLAAIDLLFATESPNFEAVLNQLDEPRLLLGLVGVAVEYYQSPIRFKTETVQLIVGTDGPICPHKVRMPAPRTIVLSRAIARIEVHARDVQTRYDPAATFDGGIDQLEQLARLTYVPSSASSRAGGAGAGLNDDD